VARASFGARPRVAGAGSRLTAEMRVAVIGTGLIGASVGLAARRAGHEVPGWDADEGTLAAAAGRGAVEPAASEDEAVAGAELVVVALPVTMLTKAVEAALAAAPAAASSAVDAGSTAPRSAAEARVGASASQPGTSCPARRAASPTDAPISPVPMTATRISAVRREPAPAARGRLPRLARATAWPRAARRSLVPRPAAAPPAPRVPARPTALRARAL
jgi:threonine dehydrogenase-like Zn-dependent dehydrogenase